MSHHGWEEIRIKVRSGEVAVRGSTLQSWHLHLKVGSVFGFEPLLNRFVLQNAKAQYLIWAPGASFQYKLVEVQLNS